MDIIRTKKGLENDSSACVLQFGKSKADLSSLEEERDVPRSGYRNSGIAACDERKERGNRFERYELFVSNSASWPSWDDHKSFVI